MPIGKEAMTAYQQRRRALERPCQGCGRVGVASEVYRATEAAAPIRCCRDCYDKIATALNPAHRREQVAKWEQEQEVNQRLSRRWFELMDGGMPGDAAAAQAKQELRDAGLLA